MNLIWPSAAMQRNLVGGKASVLGELFEDFRVPPFFCLSTDGIEHWEASKEDPSVQETLRVALARLDPAGGASFAVRSSAVGEDGAATSFAGQYTTVLGVKSLPELIAAIDLCVQSARSARVSAYQGGGAQGSVPPMGVIVQRLIRACASVAAFSLDPSTGSTEEVLVNAVWGLGESLLGGHVTPDTFALRVADGTIRVALSEKERMLISGVKGTEDVPVPESLRLYPSLSLDQVREVATLVRALERRHGYPVDVECCYEGSLLYLLQCRPITALPARAGAPTDVPC